MEVIIDDRKRVLTKGMIAISNSFEIHSYKTIGYSESYVMVLNEQYVDTLLNGKNFFRNFLPQSGITKQVFELLEYFDCENKNFNEWMLQGFFNYLFGLLVREYGFFKKSQAANKVFAINVLGYINENFRQDISLDAIATKFGYSRSHFSVLFNKYIGLSLTEYVNSLRYAEAERLLQADDSTTVEVAAAAVGFSNTSIYYRVKKKMNKDREKI